MDNERVIDELNAAVTKAIRVAEDCEAGTPEAVGAWLGVSMIEATLADLLPSDDIEGRIAREGAVSAAQKAGDVVWANELAERYGMPAERVDATFADVLVRATAAAEALAPVSGDGSPSSPDAHRLGFVGEAVSFYGAAPVPIPAALSEPYRWHVLFADGSIEPIAEGSENGMVRLSLRGVSQLFLDHPVELAYGARDLFGAFQRNIGAVFLIDTTTIVRDLAALTARFGGT